MKYRTCLTTLLYSFLLGLILPASAQNSLQHQKDSLRHALEHAEGIDKLQTYNKLYYIYMAEAGDDQKMDTLMTLFEQAEAEAIRQGDTQMQGMVYGNRIISYINRSEHDKVIEKAPAYLDFYIRHDLWKFYYQIHMQLITAYNLKGDYELAAAEAGKMYTRARERKDKAGMATALYATGIIYNLQRRPKEEEDCFRESISLLWEVSGYDNILTQSYAFLCVSLRAQARYDELLQLVPEYEKAIARFEKATGRVQPEARGNLYVALMNTYIDIKEYDKAGIYLSKLEGSVSNNMLKFELLRAKALILQSRGDYRTALAVIDSAVIQVQESAFNLNAVRKIKMEILARAGRNDEAFSLLDEIIAANDSINNVEVNARFDELRTQYEVESTLPRKSVISIISCLPLAFAWFWCCSWQASSTITGLFLPRTASCTSESRNRTGWRKNSPEWHKPAKVPHRRKFCRRHPILPPPLSSTGWLPVCASICFPVITFLMPR